MYSVLLATVLSTAGTSAQWHHHHGCHGCTGCYGGHGHSSNWGLGGSNYCSGCFASSHCWGGYGSCCSGYSCSGCYGCCGGCYGSYSAPQAYAVYGNYCYGSCCSGYMPYVSCVGCYGCYGGYSGYGPPVPAAPVQTKPGIRTEEAPLPKEKSKNDESRNVQPRATVVVEVPADAKVYIDGNLMRATSGRRVFHTPTLTEGQVYFYEIRAEIVRDGRTIVQERRVVLNPGDRIAANFSELQNAQPATVTAAEEENED